MGEGKDDEAKVIFAAVLRHDPGVAKRIDEAWASAYVGRGKKLLDESKDSEAEIQFAKAVERNPDAKEPIAKVYVSRGRASRRGN
ncbi:MAG: hypothetical protein ACREC6_09740 [Hyphomicrobiaceae bacterium]